MVNEKVLAAVIGSDKTVALLVVEPLDRSLRHASSPAFLFWALQQQSPPSSAPAIYQALKPENACTDADTLLLLHSPTAADRGVEEMPIMCFYSPWLKPWVRLPSASHNPNIIVPPGTTEPI